MCSKAITYLLKRRTTAYESSSSSSDSDDEFDMMLKDHIRVKRKRRPRIINYEGIISHYSDDDFKSHFR